jgi:polyisoprenoid-binding protein YceI
MNTTMVPERRSLKGAWFRKDNFYLKIFDSHINMKKTAFLLLITIIAKMAAAQYKPVDQGSVIKFTIENFGFDVNGTFQGLTGVINFDPENLPASNFDVSLDATSVNTGNNLRDKHLKDADYFDVSHYPRIRLASSNITGKNESCLFTGALTIKGKTRQITFPFTAGPVDDGYIFKGSFKIKRKDYGLGGISTIADELEVNLMIHAVAAKKV